VYCQHETEGLTQHFGHHEHQHHGADASSDSDSKPAGTVDNDCGACHAAGVAALLGIASSPAVSHTCDRTDGYRYGLRSPPVAEPERPNWSPLA
jgi:hypothetical protein